MKKEKSINSKKVTIDEKHYIEIEENCITLKQLGGKNGKTLGYYTTMEATLTKLFRLYILDGLNVDNDVFQLFRAIDEAKTKINEIHNIFTNRDGK